VPADAPAAFFCYSRDDSDFALRLAEDLKVAGANVWIGELDTGGGEDWSMAIEAAMAECRSMIVVLSSSSVASKHVRAEYLFAFDAGKKLSRFCTAIVRPHFTYGFFNKWISERTMPGVSSCCVGLWV